MRCFLPIYLTGFVTLAACGASDPATTSSSAGTGETGSTSTTEASSSTTAATGFTDSTSTSASDSTSTDPSASDSADASEDEVGSESEEEETGGEMGTPGAQESVLEVFGTLGSAGELNGDGAFVFVEWDAMGLPVERCLIEFIATHVSTPSDCAACSVAFETAFSEVETVEDIDGGCAASGFDATILDTPMKWGIAGEELQVDAGMGWMLVPEGEAWNEAAEMEAGFARFDLGVNSEG